MCQPAPATGAFSWSAGSTTAQDDVCSTDVYKVALEIFSGKRFGCPSVGLLHSHLDPFVGQPATAFLQAGSVLATRFNDFEKGLQSSFKSISAKKDVWTKPYLAPRLSLLLYLRQLREEEKRGEASGLSENEESKHGCNN